MNKYLLSVVFLMMGCFAASGQNNSATKTSDKKAARGTYQFIVAGSRAQVAFADEILYEVEKSRHDKEVKYLQLGEQAKVKILPRSEINSPGFVPLKDEIVFEN